MKNNGFPLAVSRRESLFLFAVNYQKKDTLLVLYTLFIGCYCSYNELNYENDEIIYVFYSIIVGGHLFRVVF